MKMDTLRDWYLDLLKDSYNAEKQITEALPKMARAAKSAQLRRAFEQHLDMTRKHIERLDEIFSQMGETPGNKTCKGMEGLIKEGEELLQKKAQIDPEVMDAALIASAQKVEHYEIAGYGTAAAYAQLLGEKQAAKTLSKIAEEEGRTDQKLTQLAESGINKEAKRQEAAKGRGKKTTSARSKSNGKTTRSTSRSTSRSKATTR